MPVAPKHPCPRPGCPTLIERGEKGCLKHRPAPWGGARPSPASSGWEWQRIRDQVLAEEPVCRLRLPGCIVISATVDHILARAFGGTNDRHNLRGLCRNCAKVKDKEDANRGRRG